MKSASKVCVFILWFRSIISLFIATKFAWTLLIGSSDMFPLSTLLGNFQNLHNAWVGFSVERVCAEDLRNDISLQVLMLWGEYELTKCKILDVLLQLEKKGWSSAKEGDFISSDLKILALDDFFGDNIQKLLEGAILWLNVFVRCCDKSEWSSF